MNTDTGEINLLTNFKPEERDKVVALTPDQHSKLLGMNREARRIYYKQHRKEFKGQTWQEINGLKKI